MSFTHPQDVLLPKDDYTPKDDYMPKDTLPKEFFDQMYIL